MIDDLASVIGIWPCNGRKKRVKPPTRVPTGAFVIAARPRLKKRRPPRLLPRPPVRTIEPVPKRLLWLGQRPLLVLICRLATAGVDACGHWRGKRAAIWSCVPPAPPQIIKATLRAGGQWI